MNYAFTDSIAAAAGDRRLIVDYNDGGYLFDVTSHGHILGVVFDFKRRC